MREIVASSHSTRVRVQSRSTRGCVEAEQANGAAEERRHTAGDGSAQFLLLRISAGAGRILSTISARCAPGWWSAKKVPAFGGFSVALVAFVALESDQPVESVTVDDLPVECAPGPPLQVINDLATFGEVGEPPA